MLPRQNKIDGHDVMILASTETFANNNKLTYIEPSRYINEDGIDVVRIPYYPIIPRFIMKKIRAYKDTIDHISKFRPDIILFHGASAYDIINVAKYKMNHPNVKLYVDSHEDFNNSARNFISKFFLHRMLYRRFLHKVLPYIEKVLCISIESYDFMKKFYNVPTDKLEIYPLGGTIYSGEEYEIMRKQKRDELKLRETDILFVHSGKMDKLKRTSELLQAFSRVSSDNFKLILLGSIPKDMEAKIFLFIGKDRRVKFLGWKNSIELQKYLCSADMYLQPGSQSATMQNAICCGCPIMLYPYKSHELYLKGNGYFVNTVDDMIDVFNSIKNNPKILNDMRKGSCKIASDLLDYRRLASRLYK